MLLKVEGKQKHNEADKKPESRMKRRDDGRLSAWETNRNWQFKEIGEGNQ
jgi:hypothetical protein